MLIDSPQALARALEALLARDRVLRGLVETGAAPPLRKREPGFAGLVSIVVSQQVSTASAAAILARVLAVFVPLDPARILAAPDEDFRHAGLSRPKIRTIRAVAAAVEAGTLPFDELGTLPAEEARARLTAVSGIGPWTADIYLKFCLGHADAFASGDLALQEAARLAYGLERRPDAAGLAALAEAWRPWRAVAAGVLWAYYRQVKSREGAPGA